MLTQALSTAKHTAPGKYPSLHMACYLLDVMCVIHAYVEMGWAWQPGEFPIYVYCKIL
jgi:hypothetical protein